MSRKAQALPPSFEAISAQARSVFSQSGRRKARVGLT